MTKDQRTIARPAEAFGRRLSAIRRRRNLTQQQLADRAGITRAYLSWVESGRGWARHLHQLCALADALDVSVDTLLGRDRRREAP